MLVEVVKQWWPPHLMRMCALRWPSLLITFSSTPVEPVLVKMKLSSASSTGRWAIVQWLQGLKRRRVNASRAAAALKMLMRAPFIFPSSSPAFTFDQTFVTLWFDLICLFIAQVRVERRWKGFLYDYLITPFFCLTISIVSWMKRSSSSFLHCTVLPTIVYSTLLLFLRSYRMSSRLTELLNELI